MMFARLFAAKQLKVSDDVIAYLAARSSRNFEEMNDIVQKIDRLSLQEKRNITINLIKKILG
jgi:chromosomal replication initiation ATPase DnaA